MACSYYGRLLRLRRGAAYKRHVNDIACNPPNGTRPLVAVQAPIAAPKKQKGRTFLAS